MKTILFLVALAIFIIILKKCREVRSMAKRKTKPGIEGMIFDMADSIRKTQKLGGQMEKK